MKPLDRYIALVGDSRTKNSFGGTAPTITGENYGHGAHYCSQTGGRVRTDAGRCYATPGHTSADVLNNMPGYIASGGDVFVNLFTTNDRNPTNNFSLTRSKRNVETILKMQLDAGKIPLMIAELPRFGANALSGDQLLIHMAMREWFLERMPDFGIRVSDPWPLLTEAHFVDGLHPNQPGGILVAKPTALHFLDLYGTPLILPTYDEPYDATYCKGGWLTANPLMLGTSGTRSGTANATGPVADNWTVVGSSWAGGSVTCSKEPNPDGGEYQVFELGGTPTQGSSTLILEQVIPLASLATGNILRGIGKVVYSGLSGVGGVSIDLRFVRGGTGYFMKSLDRYAEGYQMSPGPETGPQETPYLTVDTATDTEIKLRAVIYGCQNVPIRGIVKVGQCASEKVL
ncbi:SGNH/GDSL hydrolase family protein [Azotobacter chroococcum]|uniref:SGNH/GDSL hydrolase family protein n=1 Tax=Azotobacter chroococcum TaxID=353 RepID=A0AAP9YGX4_9GAMM|nr:SGNH/GDSL hydrolase family protein [Azotobacter chroococcum]QQE90488.1 SGNH/GDSL hydrolase family protein [Azotobacter chroococcum]